MAKTRAQTKKNVINQLKKVDFPTRDGQVRFTISSKAAAKKRKSPRTPEQVRSHMKAQGLPNAFIAQALKVQDGYRIPQPRKGLRPRA